MDAQSGNRLNAALRVRAGRVKRLVGDATARIDPTRLALDSRPVTRRTTVLCIYRRRNAGVLRELLRTVPQATVRLWSLDADVPADLAPVTVGSGPGMRLALLNRLVADVPAEVRSEALVLVDDDVRLVVGDLPALIEAGQRLRLDLWQPAHLPSSFRSWPLNRRRNGVFARLVDFVEQGPLVVLSPPAQEVVLPLPEDLDMGWGVEVRWHLAARRTGLRLGIVDAVGMRHLGPVGTGYDRVGQEAVLAREVAAAGLADVRELHVEHGRTGPLAAHRQRRRPGQ